MEIPDQIFKFKFHIFFGIIIPLSLFIIVTAAPSLLDLLAYFWPLFASTAIFLAVVVVFSRFSPPATDAPGEKAAEGLLDYVAGQPEVVGGSY